MIIVIRNPLVTDEFEKSIVRVYGNARPLVYRVSVWSKFFSMYIVVNKCRRRCPNRVLITGVQNSLDKAMTEIRTLICLNGTSGRKCFSAKI